MRCRWAEAGSRPYPENRKNLAFVRRGFLLRGSGAGAGHKAVRLNPSSRLRFLIGLLIALMFHGLEGVSVRGGNATETILQTGGGMALTRVTLPIVVPSNYPSASVRFDVAFVTNERVVAGEFLDSFTVSLRNSNRTVVATVLTVDRFGIIWAPASPGALRIRAEDLQFEPGPVPQDGANFLFQANFTVLVELPAPLLTEPAVLVLSLFDNQDQEASRATVANVRVKLGLASLLVLESSATPSGPYARESSVSINRIRQTLSVPKAGGARFFRLRGDTNSRIVAVSRPGRDSVLHYDAELGQLNLHLEGANNPLGPFTVVANAQFNLSARTVSVPLFNAPGFFRIAGSHPARIISDEVTGEQRILGFEVRPKVPQLESSAQVAGPFAEEMSVVADAFAQRLRLPGGGAARFYRVAAEVPLLLRGISLAGENIVVSYEEP